MKIFNIFQSDKKHRKGLLPLEWIVVAYTLLTTLWILFAYTEPAQSRSAAAGAR